MATFLEIHNALNTSTLEDLRKKIWVAVLIKAQAIIINDDALASQKSWANSVLRNPNYETECLLHFVIGLNSGLTIAQMAGAADNSVQTAVNNAITALYQ